MQLQVSKLTNPLETIPLALAEFSSIAFQVQDWETKKKLFRFVYFVVCRERKIFYAADKVFTRSPVCLRSGNENCCCLEQNNL